MPAILFVATVDTHFEKFHLPYLQWFKEQGWEVHIAARGDRDLPYVDRKFDIPFERSPFRKGNLQAYRELSELIGQQTYEVIHCHTPMGGMLARLAGWKARRNGTKILYTAHGFHFCKGAPLINWLLYYPIEKGLSRLTDCLITINSEDYRLARSRHFHASEIAHVSGVGVQTERFRPLLPEEKLERRKELGLEEEGLLLFYAAEFNKNKNQQFLIQALARIRDEVPAARLVLAGSGPLLESCRELANRLDVADRIDFLGYRDDVMRLMPACDIAVASSLREGLPVNIMEAMASGLPIVATDNRGHSELVRDSVNGYIVSPGDAAALAQRLAELGTSSEVRERMGQESLRLVTAYSVQEVKQQLGQIYARYAWV
ncbi:glycosyltransferase family 4 protein [Gorillibacterium timonense]|uniref:glycosyltransferase family 4 protein n=1 Tax=Gorillibacterium timonense TaxID=1689269 RepID=UPI00071CEC08|nr:glycosyltransferase family 4 protein [Gorillibacterium timonense]